MQSFPDDIFLLKTKFQRGKEILLEYAQNYNTGIYSDNFNDYVGEILNAVTWHGYDAPIPLWRMCQALEVAERRNKKLSIQPAPEFRSGGSKEQQCDGWYYVIEYV